MNARNIRSIFTVGHSTHLVEQFAAILEKNSITAVADVRSRPFSRYNPQFNRDALSLALRANNIAYVFLGKELGARTDDQSCYENGQVKYNLIAQTALFQSGIERLEEGAKKYRVALMCAEKEPLDCHRTLLVSRALERNAYAVSHILANGKLESHEQSMSRLLDLVGLPQEDMFRSRAELVEKACELREQKIAYVESNEREQ